MGPHVADRGERPGHDHRRQGGGEDEARGGGADEVDHLGTPGDVAAMRAEALGERPLDDIDPVRHAVALGHARPLRSVEAHRVHLVEIGERAVFLGEIADGADRGDVAIHRIDALEGDQLGRLGRGGGEQRFEMGEIVVAENVPPRRALAHPGDHRGVVLLVREHFPAGEAAQDGLQRGVVGDIARGEEERCLLAMQVGELGLERVMQGAGPGDVAGAPRPHPVALGRLRGGGEGDLGNPHAEIVIRGPDGDVPRHAVAFPRIDRIARGIAAEGGELAIAALRLDFRQSAMTQGVKRVFHRRPPISRLSPRPSFPDWFGCASYKLYAPAKQDRPASVDSRIRVHGRKAARR